MRFFPAVLFACVAAGSLGVSAQDQFERQVREQLNRIGQSLQAKGYELTHQVYTGSLREGATEGVAIRLQRGVRYAIVGVCDQDCSDLDTRLFDPSQREIGRDVEQDDTPVVEFEADRTGEYILRVEMAACSDEPCAFGVGVFAVGQDEFDKQIRTQLEETARELRKQGFRLTHQIFTGSLRNKEREDVLFQLDRGASYVVVGVCDNDCRDLDLGLYNAAGKEVDTDVTGDDTPVVAVSPTRSEQYTVRVLMADCGNAPCRYGLGVFAK